MPLTNLQTCWTIAESNSNLSLNGRTCKLKRNRRADPSNTATAKRSCMLFQSCSSIPLPNPSRDTINQANARLTSSYSDSRTLPPIKHKTTDCHGLFNSPAMARQMSQATLIGFTAISLVKCGEAYKTG